MIASLILFSAIACAAGSIRESTEGALAPMQTDPQSKPPEAKPQIPDAKPKPDGNRLVKVALAADHATIRAGETCTLAVKLAIEPKWHIYWQNPGDAGVPTKVEVHAPKGFVVGAVQYPTPEREESAGDIVSYVYTGEAVLLVDVKAPKDLAPSKTTGAKVEFDVDCSWLVCTSVCLPGKGKASIELPVAEGSDASRLANEKEFAGWRAKLPRPYEDLLAIAGFHASEFTTPAKPFEVFVPGALALDFYPYVEEPITLNVATLNLKRTSDGCAMSVSFEPPAGYEGPRYGFSGLIVVHTAQGEACYFTSNGFAPFGELLNPKKR
jgi:thiol:disulfide interchange protein DsbD